MRTHRQHCAEPVVDTVENAQKRVHSAAKSPSQPRMRDQLAKIRRDCSTLPVLDERSPDEILG